jgi:hypothetical protein
MPSEFSYLFFWKLMTVHRQGHKVGCPKVIHICPAFAEHLLYPTVSKYPPAKPGALLM